MALVNKSHVESSTPFELVQRVTLSQFRRQRLRDPWSGSNMMITRQQYDHTVTTLNLTSTDNSICNRKQDVGHTSPPRTRVSKKTKSEPKIHIVRIQDTTWNAQTQWWTSQLLNFSSCNTSTSIIHTEKLHIQYQLL